MSVERSSCSVQINSSCQLAALRVLLLLLLTACLLHGPGGCPRHMRCLLILQVLIEHGFTMVSDEAH